MNIGFIGAGKVGKAFGLFLKTKGLQVIGYSNRSKKHLEEAVQLTNTQSLTSRKIIEQSQIIFITTKDDVIQQVLEESIEEFQTLKGKTFIHMSGAHSASILNKAKQKDGIIASIHPLQSVSDPLKASKDFNETYFSFESPCGITENVQEILNVLPNYFKISSDQKPIYHLAACVFSNYLTTLMAYGTDLMDSIGIDSETSIKAMWPLIQGTLKNIESKGINHALTGPLARGDRETIELHLKSLKEKDNALLGFYKDMGLKTLDYMENNEITDIHTRQVLRHLLEDDDVKNNN